jgi:general secretion pathway protein D
MRREVMVKRALIALLLALTPLTPLSAQYVLNLREADIRAFIQDAARVTGRTFILDPAVQGRVSVVTERPLSRSEYFELFLSTLRTNGYVAVPAAGGALRIQPVAGAAASARLGARHASPSGFVTEIFRVRHIDPAQAIETLRPSVSRDGSITASRSAIVVSDFADNVRRVRQLLAAIDVDSSTTRVVGLDNAGAREIASALASLAGDGVGVVPVDSANSLVIRGDAASVDQLARVAHELDQRAASGSEVRVVYLEHADAAQLVPVLQRLLGQAPTEAPPQTQAENRLRRPGDSNAGAGPSGATMGRRAPAQPQPAAASAPAQAANPEAQVPVAARNAIVTRFEGANAIVISATADIQRQLGEVIRQLDVRRQQVLVEAIIVEISDTAARQLGVQLLLSGLSGNIPFAITNYSNISPNIGTIAGALAARELNGTTTTIQTGDGSTTTTTGNGTTDLINAAAGELAGISGGVGGLAIRSGNAIFGSIISAVRNDSNSNLLSTPHIMTLDNQEAYILVGQEIPVTTGEALSPNFDNAFRTVQRQNVGITLEVRPQINAGGAIKLDLRVEVSSVAGPVSSTFQDLILNKREIENTITVDDGQIAAIGGLLDDNDRRTIERIPLLGDIPIIGNLFRARSRAHARTNLMIFIRPTILRTADDTAAMSARRFDYMRGRQLLFNPDREPSLDELVRDYMGTTPPSAHATPRDVIVPPPPAAAPPAAEAPAGQAPDQPARGTPW